MKILYILKEDFSMYPPCVAQVMYLRRAGAEVEVLVGDCSAELRKTFEAAQVTVHVVGRGSAGRGAFGKAQRYRSFRSKVERHLAEHSDLTSFGATWFGTVDSAIALYGTRFPRPFGLSVLELYDENRLYRSFLSRVAPHAAVVVASEPTRAAIMRQWFSLSRTPLVAPNIPFGHPRQPKIEPSSRETAEAIDRMNGLKVLLYQGLVRADRTLVPLARALAANHDAEWALCLMGPAEDADLSALKEAYSETHYLGCFAAPVHLQVTSHAMVGVANYDWSSLNNVFCAPNKIFEYAGFGIPVLGNEVPGLTGTVQASGAGLCTDLGDPARVRSCLESLEGQYSSFSRDANTFFDALDLTPIFSEALQLLRRSFG